METIREALRLLKRQSEIRQNLLHTRTSRVIVERELYLIGKQLREFPEAVQAIALTAAELHRPVDALSVRDVEKRC